MKTGNFQLSFLHKNPLRILTLSNLEKRQYLPIIDQIKVWIDRCETGIVNGKPLQQYMLTVLQSFFLDYSFMFRPWLTTKGSLSKVLLQRLFSKGIFLKAWFSIGYFPKGSYQRLLFPMVLSRKFSFPLIFFKYTFPKPLYKSTFLKALSKRYLSRVTFPQRVLCPKTFPAVLLQWDALLRLLSWGPFPKITFPKIFFSSIFLLLLSLELPVFSFFFYIFLMLQNFFPNEVSIAIILVFKINRANM